MFSILWSITKILESIFQWLSRIYFCCPFFYRVVIILVSCRHLWYFDSFSASKQNKLCWFVTFRFQHFIQFSTQNVRDIEKVEKNNSDIDEQLLTSSYYILSSGICKNSIFSNFLNGSQKQQQSILWKKNFHWVIFTLTISLKNTSHKVGRAAHSLY